MQQLARTGRPPGARRSSSSWTRDSKASVQLDGRLFAIAVGLGQDGLAEGDDRSSNAAPGPAVGTSRTSSSSLSSVSADALQTGIAGEVVGQVTEQLHDGKELVEVPLGGFAGGATWRFLERGDRLPAQPPRVRNRRDTCGAARSAIEPGKLRDNQPLASFDVRAGLAARRALALLRSGPRWCGRCGMGQRQLALGLQPKRRSRRLDRAREPPAEGIGIAVFNGGRKARDGPPGAASPARSRRGGPDEMA